jgi:hypothetical protein
MNIDVITMPIWRRSNDKVSKKSISIVFITTKLYQNQLITRTKWEMFLMPIRLEYLIKLWILGI